MKNFDTARAARRQSTDDRTFTFAGEQFVAVPAVRPEELMGYESITEDTSASETLQIVDELILVMVEDDPTAADITDPRYRSHERYRAIRERRQDPISVQDLLELAEWIVQTQTGRPTGPAGNSSPELALTGT